MGFIEEPFHRVLVGREGSDVKSLALRSQGVEISVFEALRGAHDCSVVSELAAVTREFLGLSPELGGREPDGYAPRVH